MDRYTFNIGDNPYEVKIISIKKQQAEIDVNGVIYDVDISDLDDLAIMTSLAPAGKAQTTKPKAVAAARPVIASASSQPKAAVGDIVAPMPGQILKVLVSEGDSIGAGDVVVTMEAMKMENKIKTISEGKVIKILVKEGDTVAEGAPLVSMGG